MKNICFKTRVMLPTGSEGLKDVTGYTDGTFFYYHPAPKGGVAAVLMEVGLTLDGTRYKSYAAAQVQAHELLNTKRAQDLLKSELYEKQKQRYLDLLIEDEKLRGKEDAG